MIHFHTCTLKLFKTRRNSEIAQSLLLRYLFAYHLSQLFRIECTFTFSVWSTNVTCFWKKSVNSTQSVEREETLSTTKMNQEKEEVVHLKLCLLNWMCQWYCSFQFFFFLCSFFYCLCDFKSIFFEWQVNFSRRFPTTKSCLCEVFHVSLPTAPTVTRGLVQQ